MELRTGPRGIESAERPATEIYASLVANIAPVLRGQEMTIRKVLAVLTSGGHVLLEDVPGTGKTTLAKALAKSLAVDFQRIQFTPDLLPADILGVSIYEQGAPGGRGSFRFHPGPVFTDVLLADEINRASPRTQSALLEAMGEFQVSLDGQRRALAETFFVLATQNPTDFAGTYPLPESQMDRFTLRLGLGYVTADEEVAILSERTGNDPLDELIPVAGGRDVLMMRRAARAVRVSDELKHFIVELVQATRGRDDVQVGASPRASLALLKTAQALALFDGDEFVTPDHIQEVAIEVIAHRLVLEPEASYSGLTEVQVAREVLADVRAPS